MKNKRIITCASYGGTGSSAITDLLGEFSNCKSLGDYEFTFLHYPDGVLDLEYNLIDRNSRLNTGYSIYKFENMINKIEKGYREYFGEEFKKNSKEFIEKLIEVKWLGSSEVYITKEEWLAKIKRKLQNKWYKLIKSKKRIRYERRDLPMYYSHISKEEFYKYTKEYMENIFKCLDKENKYENIAIDQLFPSSSINKYLNYFNDIKVIVVDRDPRDLYILNREFWKEPWIPEDIDIFIKWFNLQREPQKKEIEEEDKEKVLRIQFEDLIYKYDGTVNKILKFLDLKKEDHIEKYKYLDPKISINNTQLFKKYKKYEKECNKIELELNKYLYKYN